MAPRRAEQGQALTELIIVFPLFVVACFGFVALFAQQARLFVDKANTLILASATHPAEATELVLNPSLARENATGSENGRFRDAALVSRGERCDDNRAHYNFNRKEGVAKSTVTLGTCAPKAGYENLIKFVEPGATTMRENMAASPFAATGDLAKPVRKALPWKTLAAAPQFDTSFVVEDYIPPNQHPFPIPYRFVGTVSETRQMTLCLAEFCVTKGGGNPLCAIGGGIAILGQRFSQTGTKPNLCPILETAVSTQYEALRVAWRLRLTTLLP
jgi:hypothetical protein